MALLPKWLRYGMLNRGTSATLVGLPCAHADKERTMRLVKADKPSPTGLTSLRGFAVTASLLALTAVTAATAVAGPAAAATTPATHQVKHWGTFFGDASTGAAGTQLSPVAL